MRSLNESKDILLRKSYKGNSAAIVDKETYMKGMENLLSGQRKHKRVILKSNTFLNFEVNQESVKTPFLRT